MALSCMKYLHSVSEIFETFVEDRRFFNTDFTYCSVNVTYLNLGEKTISALGTSSFGGQESIQK